MGKAVGWDDEKQFSHAYPRQEGKEVVLLVVDDIARVPLVSLLRVPEPDTPRPGLPPATAPQALTAPAQGPFLHQ